jgi:hypothetical protein
MQPALTLPRAFPLRAHSPLIPDGYDESLSHFVEMAHPNQCDQIVTSRFATDAMLLPESCVAGTRPKFRMQKLARILLALSFACGAASCVSQQTYPGFDRNDYPGDSALSALRNSFRYTSYWLNNPPGEKQNTWTGKRPLLKQHGFGFLVLFNGRLDAELKTKDPALLGAMDGKEAVTASAREGFGPRLLIFLDQEEGGRLLPEQAAYLFAWVQAVRNGGDRAGIYCSGIDVPDGVQTVSTAQDIEKREAALTPPRDKAGAQEADRQRLALWIANDQCPPSPGCTETRKSPSAGLPFFHSNEVLVWQYAQSPRRKQLSQKCPENYDHDGNCYAQGLAHSTATFLDLDVADSDDPSEAP